MLYLLKILDFGYFIEREHCYYIFPQQLHKFTFKEKNSTKIFQCLQNYLEYVYKKLCGEEINKPEEQPGFIIFHNDDLGNKVEENDAALLIEDLACKFIKEKVLSGEEQNPEKALFNFLLNFIPLIQFLYKKVLKPDNSLTELVEIRNQMIHNFCYFYKNNETAPYLAFQNKLRDVKEILLKINFCSKISRDLNSYLENEERLIKSLESFKDLFSEELNPQTIDGSVANKTISFLDVKKAVDKYFDRLFIVDNTFNEIKIENVTIKNFVLPEVYYGFSTEKRKSILQLFRALEELKLSTISEVSRQKLEDNLRNELELNFGMTNLQIDYIYSCGENAKEYDRTRLTKEILKHLSLIKKLNENSKFNIQNYYEYLENNPNPYVEKTVQKLKLRNFRERIFNIKINSTTFRVKLSKILKNFISVFFNIYPNNSTTYENLESVFQDCVVIELISCRMSDVSKIKNQVTSHPFLVPLVVELLCSRKLKLEIEEERDFILYLTEQLLTLETGKEYLNDLFSFKLKDKSFEFSKDCLDLVIKKDLIKSNLEKVDFLFTIRDIQLKLMHLLRCDSSAGFDNLFISFLNFQYNLALKIYREKNYEEALALVDGKPAGLSLVVKEGLHKNIFRKKITLDSRFLIAKIKYQVGIRHYSKIEDEERKHLNKSLQILRAILGDVSNADVEEVIRISWELRAYLLFAHICHMARQFKDSLDLYIRIFLKLYTINDTDVINEQLFNKNGCFMDKVSHIHVGNKIKALMMSEKYKSAIKANSRDLNIRQILKCYLRELFLLMKSLNNKEILFRGDEAIKSCEYVINIQTQISHNKIFIAKAATRYLFQLRKLLHRARESQSHADTEHD